MKIAISIFNAPWHVMGGAEIHSWELANNLSNLGNEVHFFYANSSNEPVKRKEGVYLHPIILPFIDKLKNRRHLMLPLFNWRVQKEIRRMDIDIFHSQNHQGLTFGKKKFAIIVTIHASVYSRLIESLKKFPRGFFNDISLILEHFNTLVTKRKIKFISVADHVQDDLKRWYSIESIVVPNGVNKPEKIPKEDAKEGLGISDWEKVILFFSRVTEEKAPHKLLDIIEEQSDIGLLICGAGRFNENIGKMVENRNLQGRVKILGFVNNQSFLFKNVFSAADCFALPSKQEGQPITILEAMSYGLPCYVTNKDWVPPYLRKFAVSGNIKTGVLEALEMGRQDINVMTWLDVAKKTQKIYNEILG